MIFGNVQSSCAAFVQERVDKDKSELIACYLLNEFFHLANLSIVYF